MRSALNSSVVWELTTEGERPFHCGIVRGKKEFFRASLYVWYIQYWALCDALVDFKLRAGLRYLSFSIDTAPECILCRALGNAELRVLGCRLFAWGAWFSPGGSSACACFFSRHVSKIQQLSYKYTLGDQNKSPLYYRLRNTFRVAGEVCLC